MIYRHVGHREEAEDVLQQAFLQAYLHLSDFRGQAKFHTWLYTISLNHVKNHLRQRKLRRMISTDDKGNWEEDAEPKWADTLPTPDVTVEQRLEVQAVQKVVETLQEEHKSIFILFYFQHLSLLEIAKRLAKPVGTVKVYLHRARKAVRLALLDGRGVVLSEPEPSDVVKDDETL